MESLIKAFAKTSPALGIDFGLGQLTDEIIGLLSDYCRQDLGTIVPIV